MTVRRAGRRLARGFTLVEVIVAVALMALASAVVIPQLDNLTRAELRRGARQLSANVRRCFDQAALTGQIHRMTFTLGEPEASRGKGAQADQGSVEPIAIEASEMALNFTGHDGALKEASDPNQAENLADSPFGSNFGAGDAFVPPASDADAVADPATPSAAGNLFRDMFAINRLARKAGQPNFDAVGTVHLPRGVRVTDVWVEGMHDAVADGVVSLVFFPTGYTQKARLHLEDGGKNVFTLEVEPLTGQVWVAEGYFKDLAENAR